MSFADTAHHLVQADKWLFQKLQDPSLKPMVGQTGIVHIGQREEYLSLLRELKDIGRRRSDLLRQMTEEQLAEMIFDARFGNEVSVWWIVVRGNLDHEIHHRGQLAAWLTLLQQ